MFSATKEGKTNVLFGGNMPFTMSPLSYAPRTLSIVIPAYNEGERLKTTVTSTFAAAEQTLDEFEIIVVNDGSNDATATVANELAAAYPNISAIHHRTNLGVGAAYSSGLQVARHPFLTLVPGDNAFESYCLPAFFSAVNQADIIISYRNNPAVRTPIRRLLSVACTTSLYWATGVPLRDGHSLYIWSVEKARRITVPLDYRYHLTTLCALLVESATYAQLPVHLTPKPDASSRVLRPKVVLGLAWMMAKIVVKNRLKPHHSRPREVTPQDAHASRKPEPDGSQQYDAVSLQQNSSQGKSVRA